jgi:glycosyltransferase involved in cell wall biosynthesis
MSQRRICFYSPANLNNMDGSTIWVHAVAETLHVGQDNQVTVPLRAAERRATVTGALRRLPRVELLAPADLGYRNAATLTEGQALDAIEALDRDRPFDVILLRSFDLSLAAARRPRLAGRLWSAYILEPERDPGSAAYLADMDEIANASRYVVSQSEEMRSLTEALLPAARDRTILLPPAIPAAPAARPDPGRIVPRLLYAGKFSPFYPVDRMIEFLTELRRDEPRLTFEVIGDKFGRMPGNPDWQHDLRHALTRTPGVRWHGAIPREEVEALFAPGGIALSLWDYRHGSTMNDLVISTKLLDYASVGLPVILMRTEAQEALLGADYPLFVEDVDEALPLLRRLLVDAGLWRMASERTFEASRRFTYPAVYARMAAFIEGAPGSRPVADALVARDKASDAWFNVGLVTDGAATTAGVLGGAIDLVGRLLERDERYHLALRVPREAVRHVRDLAVGAVGGRPIGVSVTTVEDEGLGSWLRTIGFLVADAGPDAADAGSGSDLIASAIASGTLPVDPRALTGARASRVLGAAGEDGARAVHAIATGPGRTRPAAALSAAIAAGVA